MSDLVSDGAPASVEPGFVAAWFPWRGGVDLNANEESARLWVRHHAQRVGRTHILLTSTKFSRRDGKWADFLRAGWNATLRSNRGPNGPVLALASTWKMLLLGQQLARGSALCVVEFPSPPMIGWARQVGAHDLGVQPTRGTILGRAGSQLVEPRLRGL